MKMWWQIQTCISVAPFDLVDLLRPEWEWDVVICRAVLHLISVTTGNVFILRVKWEERWRPRWGSGGTRPRRSGSPPSHRGSTRYWGTEDSRSADPRRRLPPPCRTASLSVRATATASLTGSWPTPGAATASSGTTAPTPSRAASRASASGQTRAGGVTWPPWPRCPQCRAPAPPARGGREVMICDVFVWIENFTCKFLAVRASRLAIRISDSQFMLHNYHIKFSWWKLWQDEWRQINKNDHEQPEQDG